MKASIKKRKRKFLALLLSVMMLSSATAALTSCSNGADDNSTTSEETEEEDTGTTQKDTGLIKNASFETFDDNDGLNLIGTSATGWTKSNNQTTTGSALTSKAASGIVDTAAWADLTTTKLADKDAASKLTAAEAEALWKDGLTSRDKLLFYKAWKDADENEDKKIAEELEAFYQSFNIDEDDLPEYEMANPGTHFAETETDKADDTNVLMIHNQYPATSATNPSYPNQGTAQKYTSTSTVTVKAGTSAQFSVWVKTANLTCADSYGNAQEATDKGAWINVTHTVGGKTLDAVKIENINTKGVTAYNGWVQYSFYLKGASYTDTTFTVVLGLGQGGNSDKHGHVNGYAFFDDIQCETISNGAYTEAVKKLATTDTKTWTDAFSAKAENKVVDVSSDDLHNFVLDFYGDFVPSDMLASMNASDIAATTETSNKKTYSSSASPATGTITAPWLNGGFKNTNDFTQVYSYDANTETTAAAMNNSGNIYLQSVYNNYFKGFDSNEYLKGNDILLLLSADGIAYTAHDTDYTFTLSDNSYMSISFFVKTSEMNGLTGAGVTLHEGTNKHSLSSVDTTTLSTVTLGKNEDIYDGWQKCFLFVANETGASKTFSLSFTYGTTTLLEKTTSDFGAGFAAFTGFATKENMSKEEFESAQSNTTAKIINLSEKSEDKTTNSGFDAPASVAMTTIDEGIAPLKNYIGVYSDSDYVNLNGDGTNIAENLNTNAGLLNRDYFTDPEDGYFNAYYNDYDNAPAWFTSIINAAGGKAAVDAVANKAEYVWNKVFGEDSVQPLYMLTEDETKSYGYIAKTTTSVSAGGYKAVSTKVKVSNGAKAYVYLVGMKDGAPTDVMTIGAKATYWYDKDNNICAIDPADKDFNKKTDVAFKLQSNGLYKVNPRWSGADTVDANAYYANLSAYEKDPNTNNYMVAEGGASYNYTNNWNYDGNDGVAFYYNEGKYYAESSYKTEVLDITEVTALTPRTQAQKEAKELYQVVEPTKGEWVTVTFYIHAGDETKDFRLEVWNGTREGIVVDSETNETTGFVSAKGSYVAFDFNSPASVDTNFPLLIDLYKEEADATYFESVYSFFDTDKYLRYNEDLDENKVGYAYENYLSSTYTEGVAYLQYGYETFADYSYSELKIDPSTVEEDKPEEDTTDTTTDEMNPWLLISSIVIAAILILAVLSIAARKIWTKIRRKRGIKVAKSTKENVSKAPKAKKAKAPKQTQDEDSPYND